MGELVDPPARGAGVERRTSPSLVKDTYYANHRANRYVADELVSWVAIVFMARNETSTWFGLHPDSLREL